MSRLLKIASLSLCLTACVSTPKPPAWVQPMPALEFSGRGAAAGMMLDAYLPGGAAIGVAIDVGIAKAAEQRLKSRPQGFELKTLFNHAWALACTPPYRQSCQRLQRVQVSQLGFVALPAKNGEVAAKITLTGHTATAQATQGWPNPQAPTLPFDQFTQDAEASYQLLLSGLVSSLQLLLAQDALAQKVAG